jgi:hypothetical protein
MLRHPWLAELVITGATIGPRAAGLLEYVLAVLKDHPASAAAKLTAFAVMTALIAAYVQNEIGISASAPQRQRTLVPSRRVPARPRGFYWIPADRA